MSIAAAAQRATIARVSKGHKAYAKTGVTSSFMVVLDGSRRRKSREPREPPRSGSGADKLGMGSGLCANSSSPLRAATAAEDQVGLCRRAHLLPSRFHP